MSEPKAMIESTFRESTMELSALYVVTTVGAVHLLTLHWLVAMVLAPFIIGGALLGVAIVVQLMWYATSGIDRMGNALGLRKSPLV